MTQFESVLRAERARLANKITKIDALLEDESSFPTPVPGASRPKVRHLNKGKHKMSAEVRARIAATQKKNWEAKRKAAKQGR